LGLENGLNCLLYFGNGGSFERRAAYDAEREE